MVVLKRWRRTGEILAVWYFWLTCEKVGSGFQYHHGGARCPAYGFGVVQLPAQPNRCTFVQSRAKVLFENSTIFTAIEAECANLNVGNPGHRDFSSIESTIHNLNLKHTGDRTSGHRYERGGGAGIH